MSKALEGLRFDPPPECDRAGCCDLSCVMPEPGTMADLADQVRAAAKRPAPRQTGRLR